MELDNYDTRSAPGCSRPLKACAVIMGLVLLLFVIGMVWMFRYPSIQSVVKCRANMEEVSAAVGRYHEATGAYPVDLNALKSEYLKKTDVLRCPLDESGADRLSYIYHRPDAKSKGSFVVLECDRHRLKPDMPVSRILFLKNGSFKMISPDYKDMLREKERSR